MQGCESPLTRGLGGFFVFMQIKKEKTRRFLVLRFGGLIRHSGFFFSRELSRGNCR